MSAVCERALDVPKCHRFSRIREYFRVRLGIERGSEQGGRLRLANGEEPASE